MEKGPIVLIDDDESDIVFIKEALADLKVENEIISFNKSPDALEYLKTTQEKPFFVLCDLNMPRINGFELCNRLNDSRQERARTYPFLFFSTTDTPSFIDQAFGLGIQGYFVKPTEFAELENLLQGIVNYWTGSEL
jgi:CheY-like chemotaxis protein